MKYMDGDANLTVCKIFSYYFVSVGWDIFGPIRLPEWDTYVPLGCDTYVPLDMKIPPCSLINHAITTQLQFVIVLHVTHRKARFAIRDVTLPTQSFCACLFLTT